MLLFTCDLFSQGQNTGPMMHGMGQQGPNNKGKPDRIKTEG